LFFNELFGIVKFWITFLLFFISHVSSFKQGGYTWNLSKFTKLCWRHPLEMGPACLLLSRYMFHEPSLDTSPSIAHENYIKYMLLYYSLHLNFSL
jgi:hypothetical protein